MQYNSKATWRDSLLDLLAFEIDEFYTYCIDGQARNDWIRLWNKHNNKLAAIWYPYG